MAFPAPALDPGSDPSFAELLAQRPQLTRHAALRERVRMLAADDRSDFLEKG